MRNVIKLSEEQVNEILDNEEYESIADRTGKHDSHYERIIFKMDGKHYSMWLEFNYDNGVQLFGPTEATEVHRIEKVVTVWEPVIVKNESENPQSVNI